MKITSLGYLQVESPDAKAWLTFGTKILGMATTDDPLGGPDVVSLTNDDRPGRLTITSGQPTGRSAWAGRCPMPRRMLAPPRVAFVP